MRIWSINLKYLDTKGLIALWRETLLAQNVLAGKTKGYKNHPQLIRFKNHKEPLKAIGYYLYETYLEATKRGYKFNKEKIIIINFDDIDKIFVTKGQINYEFQHLKNKLAIRDTKKLNEISHLKEIEIHSIFQERVGDIESWEIIS